MIYIEVELFQVEKEGCHSGPEKVNSLHPSVGGQSSCGTLVGGVVCFAFVLFQH